MEYGSTTEQIANFWSHAPGGMMYSELRKQSSKERAELCAAAAGSLAIETVTVVDVAQSESASIAAHAA